jgi:hypothetical protein
MATEKEHVDYEKQILDELEAAKDVNRQLTRGQMSLFDSFNDDNLIRWQLDLKEDLDKMYHLLSGHQPKELEDGSVVYAEPENPDLKPFNEFGVQTILNILSFYLNRNTILSNYDIKTIEWKVYDFGNVLANLIFNKYEEMMVTMSIETEVKRLTDIDVEKLPDGKYVTNLKFENGKLTYDELDYSVIKLIEESIRNHILRKIKMYPMIVHELVDTVHSAYLRALGGGERRELRTARTVTQADQQQGVPRYSSPPARMQPKRSLLKPWTWRS